MGRNRTTSDLLQVEGLVKEFRAARTRAVVRAVNGVSFGLMRGETLALVGESGSGKTTVGRCVLRLIEPTAGSIVFEGQDIARLSARQLSPVRARLQMVFQDPYDSLDPRMTVRQILDEPLQQRGVRKAERGQRIESLLQMVQLGSQHLDRYPSRLSGGQQQRVGIARALAMQPDLLVLDEPTASLDAPVRADLLDLLARLQAELNVAYLFISHDLGVVRAISHRTAIMYLGKIVEIGPTPLIFRSPVHPYTQALLSASLRPDPDFKLQAIPLEGEPPNQIELPPGCLFHSRCPIGQPTCAVAFPPLEEVAPDHWVACYRSSEAVTLMSSSAFRPNGARAVQAIWQ